MEGTQYGLFWYVNTINLKIFCLQLLKRQVGLSGNNITEKLCAGEIKPRTENVCTYLDLNSIEHTQPTDFDWWCCGKRVVAIFVAQPLLLHHGRDVHLTWVKLLTRTLSNKVLVLSTKSKEDLESF